MALYMTEYTSPPPTLRERPPWPTEPPIATQVFSSAATSTSALGASTRMVRIVADSNCWLLIGSTVVATSTNADKIIAGAPAEYRYVVPGARVSVLST